jgi:hypothetical protein
MKRRRMKRTNGRPRVDPKDASVQVCVTLPARRFDKFCTEARRDQVSIPEVIRRRLADADDEDDGD